MGKDKKEQNVWKGVGVTTKGKAPAAPKKGDAKAKAPAAPKKGDANDGP